MPLFWLNERENDKQTQRWLLRPQCQLNLQLTDAKINRWSVIRQNKKGQQERKHKGTKCARLQYQLTYNIHLHNR